MYVYVCLYILIYLYICMFMYSFAYVCLHTYITYALSIIANCW